MANPSRMPFKSLHSTILHEYKAGLKKWNKVFFLLKSLISVRKDQHSMDNLPFLVEVNEDWTVFFRPGHVLLPTLLVHLSYESVCRQFWLFHHLCKACGAIFLHEVIFIEVEVVIGHLFELFGVLDHLRVVTFRDLNTFLENVLWGGTLINCLPITHFHLDVFPLGSDAACHSLLFLFLIKIFLIQQIFLIWFTYTESDLTLL